MKAELLVKGVNVPEDIDLSDSPFHTGALGKFIQNGEIDSDRVVLITFLHPGILRQMSRWPSLSSVLLRDPDLVPALNAVLDQIPKKALTVKNVLLVESLPLSLGMSPLHNFLLSKPYLYNALHEMIELCIFRAAFLDLNIKKR